MLCGTTAQVIPMGPLIYWELTLDNRVSVFMNSLCEQEGNLTHILFIFKFYSAGPNKVGELNRLK